MGLEPRTSRSALPLWRGFLNLLWRTPLFAIGFGLFFWLVNGLQRGALAGFTLVAGTFALSVGLLTWLGRHFLFTRVVRPRPDGSHPVPLILAFFGGLSLLGCMLGLLALQLVFHIHLLRSGAGVAAYLAYTLLFFGLFIGVAFARNFYQGAMLKVRADQELNLARRIQQSYLPDEFPTGTGFDVHAVNLSSRQVSGDFYDVAREGESLLVVVADVSGKGVAAAMLGSMLQAWLRAQAGEKSSTAAITRTVNALAVRSCGTGKFATLFLAHLDLRTRHLRYTNAGHNPPLLFRRAGGWETLDTGGTVVGAFAGAGYEEGSVALHPGDRLLLYTDGVTEATDHDGTMFGEERLASFVSSLAPALSARELVDRVLAELDGFLGDAEPGDDITLLALTVPPGP